MFQTCPTYLSKELLPQRKDPSNRKLEVIKKQEQEKKIQDDEDCIEKFKKLKRHLLKCKLNIEDVYTKLYGNEPKLDLYVCSESSVVREHINGMESAHNGMECALRRRREDG